MTKPSDTLTTLTRNCSARRFYDGLSHRSARRFYDGLNRKEKQFSRTAFGFPIRIDLSHYPSPYYGDYPRGHARSPARPYAHAGRLLHP